MKTENTNGKPVVPSEDSKENVKLSKSWGLTEFDILTLNTELRKELLRKLPAEPTASD